MGKRKHGKSVIANKNISGPRQIIKRRQHSQSQSLQNTPRSNQKSSSQKRTLRVPFTRQDNVLLLGEGDFTFSLSLAQNYSPARMIASCFDSEAELVRKYSKVKQTIQQLLECSSKPGGKQEEAAEEWKGFSPTPLSRNSVDDSASSDGQSRDDINCKILYSVDATRLSTSHRRKLQASSPFTKIVFNFPHTGGLSTDVNRQVRANQELLVGFFNAAKPLLASTQNTTSKSSLGAYGTKSSVLRRKGQLLVTLFEGEPYTLWNIRDLARHCGLQVLESFKFPWEAYPGYQHARTIGDITTRMSREEENKRRGAWRGEERDARCYVLERKEDIGSLHAAQASKKRKPAAQNSDNDS